MEIEGIMHLHGEHKITKFLKKHRKVVSLLESWKHEIKSASWKSVDDIKAQGWDIRRISDDRVIFKLGYDKVRLDVKFRFKIGDVLVVRVGTHEAYNKWSFKD